VATNVQAQAGAFGKSGPTALVDQFSITDAALNVTFAVAHFTTTHLLLPTQGTLSARLAVILPANAIVDALEVKVTARRADEAVASEVAELRGTGTGTNAHEIIVDFGTVRTVSAVRFGVAAHILRVDAWNGTEFPANPANQPFQDPSEILSGSVLNKPFARFRSDTRTERLRIAVLSERTVGALMEALSLILPDSPKDLAITLDGGAPVWSLPGPAAKGPSAALTTDAWNSANQRLVDLTSAFAALTGDPLDGSSRSFELLLTSREAGVLEIAEHSSEIRRIRRARFGGATALTLNPEAEGVTELALAAPDTPAGAVAKQVALTVSGKFGPERRIPATGPQPRPGTDDPAAPLVSLDMAPERAIILRLAAIDGLPAFTGLRLPLRAGAEGAEVRLAPWSNAGAGRTQPAEALADLIGKPVVLAAGGPDWQTYLFAGPLEIDPENPPWVAVLVTRGTASVGLSDEGGGTARVGPPSGPWRPLPALFGAPGFQALRFPYRAIGDAPEPAAPAPLLLGVAGSDVAALAIDPAPRGARFALTGLAVTEPRLAITHLAAGEIGLADIDIIFDT
jgi:hypothetical protein